MLNVEVGKHMNQSARCKWNYDLDYFLCQQRNQMNMFHTKASLTVLTLQSSITWLCSSPSFIFSFSSSFSFLPQTWLLSDWLIVCLCSIWQTFEVEKLEKKMSVATCSAPRLKSQMLSLTAYIRRATAYLALTQHNNFFSFCEGIMCQCYCLQLVFAVPVWPKIKTTNKTN